MKIPHEIVLFLKHQPYTIVATFDREGYPHTSCKGIIKIDPAGKIYLLDVFKWRTFENLKKNPKVSVTAVDEHKFKGWCLKGKGKILDEEHITPDLVKAWEKKITSRTAERVIRNVRGEKGHKKHPETQLAKPEYMVEVDIEEIVDLTPQHMK